MSTTLRLWSIKALKSIGVKHFRATSGLGLPFVVHLNDSFGEAPFYNRETHLTEIALMFTWCRQVEQPLIVDIGGHVGFVASQLAQLLADFNPSIYSFEPVPYTFKRLSTTIRELKLESSIFPLCAAISERCGLIQVCYSEWDSMLAQVYSASPNFRIGDKSAWASSVTLDRVSGVWGRVPDLVKIDAEGHEVSILNGATCLLEHALPPALCIEFNPQTLAEAGTNAGVLAGKLKGYRMFYIDDFENQKLEFGKEIDSVHELNWVCNLFCVPRNAAAEHRWENAVGQARDFLVNN